MLQVLLDILLVVLGVKVAKNLPGSVGEVAQSFDEIIDSGASIIKGGAKQASSIANEIAISLNATPPKAKK